MSFPTLGLRFDLMEMTAGQAALKQTRDLYVEIAEAKAKAEGKSAGGAASAAQAEVAATQATIAALEKKMAVMEASFAEYRKLAQGAVAAETAVAASQQKTIAAIEAKGAAFETMSARMAAGIERAAKIEDAARTQRVAAEAEAQAKIKAIISDAQAFALETNRATTASMIALARQREAAEIESQERINAVIAAANKFALETNRAQTASMVALARQREDALAAASTAAYARAEQEARRTNTPFSVISTGKTVDPGGDFLKQLEKQQAAGAQMTEYAAKLKLAAAAELGVAESAAPMIAAMTKAGGALHAAGGSAYTFRELLVSVREIMRGDFSRLGGTLLILGQQFGIITTAIIAFLAWATLLAAPFIAFIAVLNDSERKLAQFNNALKATGGYAGISFGQMQAASEKIAASTNNAVGSIQKTVQAVVASGKVAGQAVSDVTEAATRLADLTGQKAEAVVKQLTGMYGNSSKGALELNESVHFLSSSLYDQITALEKSGDAAGAFDLTMKALAQTLKDRGEPEMSGLNGLIHQMHLGLDVVINDWERWIRVMGSASTGMDKIVDAQAGIARHAGDSGNMVVDALQHAIPTTSNLRWSVDKNAGHDLAYYQQELKVGQAQQQAAAEKAAAQGALQGRIDNQLNATIAGDAEMQRLRNGDPLLIKQKQNEFWAAHDAALALDSEARAKLAGGGLAPDTKALYQRGLLTDDRRTELNRESANKDAINADIARQFTRRTARGGSTIGIRNRLAGQEGKIAGLLADALNPAVDPISEFMDQIKTAGLQAAGRSTFGKAAGFKSQAQTNAEDLKRLEIFKQINAELGKQIQAETQRQQIETINFQAATAAAAAQDAYYQSGQTGLAGEIRLQQQLIDIQEKAKEKVDTLAILQKYGGSDVTTLDQLQQRLLTLAGGNKQLADATMTRVQADIAATVAGDRQAASDDKQKVSQDALTSALREYDTLQKQLKDDVYFANAGSDVRQAQQWILARAKILEAKGATHEYALQIATAGGLLDAQIEKWAQIKASIQDAFERTFVDSGKLDFKGLKDGFTKALRQAIYDSLIRRPIDIVVNAEVNLINQFTNAFLQPMVNRLTGGLVGALSGVVGSGASLGYSEASRAAMQDTVDAATGMKDAAGSIAASTSKFSSFLGAAGSAFFAGSIGNSLVHSLGIGGSSKASNLGGMIGGGLGYLGGQALGTSLGAVTAGLFGASGTVMGMSYGAVAGPIGMVVGAVLGSVLGGLFAGKPSNNAALATITPSGYTMAASSKTTAETAKLADAFAQAVINSEAVLKQAGITTKGYVSGIDIGTRDQPNVSFSTGEKIRLGQAGDAAAAADAAMKHLLEGATYMNAAEEQMVKSMLAAGSSFDDIAKKLQEFAQAADFLKAIDRDLLKAKDPQAGALADLRDQQIARRKQAITYFQDGVITADQMTALNDKLKELERIEIVQALQQFQGGLNDVTATLQEFQDAQKKIIDYADGLLIGSNSALSPQDQLAAAQSQFYALLSKAQTGDKGALDKITGAAGTYVDQGHSFYGSTPGFVSIFNAVEASLRSLGAQTYPTQDNSNAVSPDSQAVVAAVAALQAAITQNNADLITAVAPATNDNATSADIAGQTAALVGSLQGVQQTIAASTEAIVGAVGGNSTQVPLSLDQLMVGGAVF